MPDIWFSSDLHFSHHNVIGYCNRPFRHVEEMDLAIIEAWNDLVDPHDVVIVLGDVALGQITDSLALVRLLNGTKILVPGNHDRCWVGNRKRGEWAQRYLDAGFARIYDDPEALSIASHQVQLCHFPYVGDSEALDRFPEHRLKDQGAWLIHGHVHDMWRQRGRQINVGIDAWGGKPVSMDQISNLIEQGPKDLAPLAW